MQDDDDDDEVAGEDAEAARARRGEALIRVSGKLKLLDAMLQRLKAGGHRVLLFSQMTSMLDLLEEYLNFRRWRYQRIDGSTKATDRQARIDAYNRQQPEQGGAEVSRTEPAVIGAWQCGQTGGAAAAYPRTWT